MRYIRICSYFACTLLLVVCLCAEDRVALFKETKIRAEAGVAESQYNLGHCYYYGQGVPVDFDLAVKWWSAAALQGYADAQNNLGNCYQLGHGVKRDDSEAVRLFRLAAGQGLVDAQSNLGGMYADGRVTSHNSADLALITNAAEAGYSSAEFNLGLMYFKGYGVSKDLVAAARWYLRAAQRGNLDAQENLGLMLYNRGNFIDAARWFKAAAARGRPLSQYNLSVLYYNGEGVERDPVEAYVWLNLAVIGNHHLAVKYAPVRRAGLTTAQLSSVNERTKRILEEMKSTLSKK